jgi:hypothetical protein
MLLESSKSLAQFVAQSSFEFWQRKDFRLYTKFATLSQTEQDRIFNELELSVLGLFTLQLGYAESIAVKEFKTFFKTMQKEVPKSFVSIMADLGIEKKFLKQWQTLIDMRVKEYTDDLKIALRESANMAEFDNDEEIRNTWARIETITIDCLTHIRRGDVKEKDPLWPLLRKWFITLDTKVHPITELGKGK